MTLLDLPLRAGWSSPVREEHGVSGSAIAFIDSVEVQQPWVRLEYTTEATARP